MPVDANLFSNMFQVGPLDQFSNVLVVTNNVVSNTTEESVIITTEESNNTVLETNVVISNTEGNSAIVTNTISHPMLSPIFPITTHNIVQPHQFGNRKSYK